MTMTRRAGAVLGLAWMALGGCAAPEELEPELDSIEATHPPILWDPKPIDPRRCNPDEPQPSKPSEPGGHCDIEVRISAMTFTNGQGVSEGKGEIRGMFFANPLDVPSGTEETVAVSPTQDYSAGQSQGMSLDLGTYRVEVGDTRDIEICASFAEDDNGGSNGNDDFSQPCRTITLRCDAQTGQPSFDAPLGPEAFCEVQSDGEERCNGSMGGTISVKAADADMDEIPNEDDFTPELCDEELKGTGGIAALVYFHYDDNGLITLGQSVWTDLAKVYDAYEYVVLVADNATSNPENTSGAAWSNADRVFPPTRAGLLDAMQDLTARHYRFDTLVHAHDYKRSPTDSEFEAMKPPDHVEGDLYRISARPGSGVRPSVTIEDGTVRLLLVDTGRPGPSAVDVVLAADLRWSIRVDGDLKTGSLDLRGTEVTQVRLAGDAADIRLVMPPPDGAVPIRVTGGINRLRVSVPDRTPMRVRTRGGAGEVVLDGRTVRGVARNTAFQTEGWRDGGDGVDVDATAGLGALRTERWARTYRMRNRSNVVGDPLPVRPAKLIKR